jgi:hypothetical protein
MSDDPFIIAMMTSLVLAGIWLLIELVGSL